METSWNYYYCDMLDIVVGQYDVKDMSYCTCSFQLCDSLVFQQMTSQIRMIFKKKIFVKEFRSIQIKNWKIMFTLF